MSIASLGGDSFDGDEFYETFHRLIAQIVLRTARRWGVTSDADIEDLIQEVHLKLHRDRETYLAGFEGRNPGEMFGFVKVSTANLVHDLCRKWRSKKRGGGETPTPIEDVEAVSGGSGGPEEMEHQVKMGEVEAALERVLKSSATPERDRAVFWFYHRDGMTASEIAAIPWLEMKVKAVESLIYRLTKAVRDFLDGSGGK